MIKEHTETFSYLVISDEWRHEFEEVFETKGGIKYLLLPSKPVENAITSDSRLHREKSNEDFIAK